MDDPEQVTLARLDVIADSGNFERLLELSLDHLQSYPDSIDAHDHCVVSYIHLDESRKARPHIDFLLKTSPEDSRAQQLAASFYININHSAKAIQHIDEALRISPDNAFYHYLRSHAFILKGQFKWADFEIHQALSIEPDNPDFINLKIFLDSCSNDSTDAAWERIDQLKNALSHSPENAELHFSLGQTYLLELENPKLAESSFRTSLSIDPASRQAQKFLFQSIARISIFYRTLSIPQGAWQSTFGSVKTLKAEPWRAVLFLIFFKVAISYLVWMLAVTVVFYLPCKVYEWLLVSDLAVSSGIKPLRYLKIKLRRIPLAIRVLLFCSLFTALWFYLFRLAGINPETGFKFLTAFVIIHFVGIAIFHWSKRARVALIRRKREKSKAKTPVLESM